ncbi:MAG: alpha/beta hydrolase [Planctomycetaceae bacterium]
MNAFVPSRLAVALFACAVLLFTKSTRAEEILTGSALPILTDKPPEPPTGYSDAKQALAAVVLGQVPTIKPDDALTEAVKVTPNVEYGNVGGRALLLDLYQPAKQAAPAPGLIFIHGGAWQGGKKEDYRYYGQLFANKGYVVASVEYRLVREQRYPAAVEDCKCAVRWMREKAAEIGVNPQCIAAVGGSAGGHLALMLGYSSDVAALEGDGGHPGVSSRVQCVINLYGPCDLTTDFVRKNEFANRVTHEFLGKKIDDDLSLYQQASPITHLDAQDPPTLILHGTIDDVVPIEQGDELAAKLKELGVPYLYDRLPGWPHAMDLAKPVNDRCVWLMDRFFAAYLKVDR